MLRTLSPTTRKTLLLGTSVPATVRTATRLTRRRRNPPPPSSAGPNAPVTSSSSPALSSPSTPPSRPSTAAESTALAPVSPVSLVPVHVPHDPAGVLDRAQGTWAPKLRELLSQPAIVVARQLEMMNVFLGFEEANKYQLLGPDGRLLGWLLEEEAGFGATMSRQLLKTHRPFRATVLSPDGEVLLRVHRPFALVNSRIFVSTPTPSGSTAAQARDEMKRLEAPGAAAPSTALMTQEQSTVVPQDGDIIGEVQAEWHIYRRRYNLFVKRGEGEVFEQFARFDGGFLSWDFEAKDEEGNVVGSVNRNFSGFARELFTDTGHYVLSFDAAAADLAALPPPSSPVIPGPAAPSSSTSLTPAASPSPSTSADSAFTTPASLPLDHRATLLASAISLDIDYFSRSRGGLLGGSGFFMPLPIPMGGMGGGAAGEAGEAGAGTIGSGNAHEGPLPPTENAESEGGLRTTEGGGPRGEDGVVPGGGSGQGWGEDDGLMQDPWASEDGQEEGGTWGWGDLFPGDDGGGGGDGDW
ncbi:hypothetical protein JCM10213_006245 [Rhodosporidiobolus nylandii]